MSEYIDIGVNLTGSSFHDDLDEVVQRAVDSGVSKMIVTGTDVEHSRKAIELCQQYPRSLFATAGVHPHHADDYIKNTTMQLAELGEEDCVLAIGECGLDYNRNFSTQENQRAAFDAQLALAAEIGKPVFLHQRDAHDDFVAMLRNIRPQLGNAVAHCFTGTAAEVNDYLELDMYIGVTGWICDERRGRDLQQAVKEIPLDRVMLETDAPYLLPRDLAEKPIKSRRNEPCYLPHIAEVVSRYMGVDREELEQAALTNTKRFFNI
ncbi:MAG: YchF/TatD family DNA exonuclease [Gammaproteobacteria bacterium]|nr:YchF/TatD family DNA exonuclease [Gammaproteobacteria bacterium]